MGKVNIIKIYDVNFTHSKVLRKIKVHLLQKHRSLRAGSMSYFLVLIYFHVFLSHLIIRFY
jgi:hypothetical protein